jgi:hypothetical protein
LIGGVLSRAALSTLSKLPGSIPTVVGEKEVLLQSPFGKLGPTLTQQPNQSFIAPLPKPVESEPQSMLLPRQSSSDDDQVMALTPGTEQLVDDHNTDQVEIDDSDEEFDEDVAIDSTAQDDEQSSGDEESNLNEPMMGIDAAKPTVVDPTTLESLMPVDKSMPVDLSVPVEGIREPEIFTNEPQSDVIKVDPVSAPEKPVSPQVLETSMYTQVGQGDHSSEQVSLFKSNLNTIT